jgi:hypothetical protein
VTCDSQRSESSQVPSVPQGNQTEGNNDQQDGFFMNVPSKEKRGIATQRDGADEILPRTVPEKLDEGQDLKEESQSEACPGADFRQDGKGSIADKATRDAMQRSLIN